MSFVDDPSQQAVEPIVAAEATAEAAESAEQPQHPHAAGDYGRGTVLGLVSAFLYTCTNACLRDVTEHDIYLVSCLKALPTMLLAVALMLRDERSGPERRPSPRVVFWLTMTGLLSHIGGNVAFQWGLGIVGLAAAVPLTFAMIIVGGTWMGRFWLSEGVTPRALVAMGLLCASFVTVSLHAEGARTRTVVTTVSHDQLTTAQGVAAICFSGVAYAVLGVVIRRTVTGTVGTSYVLFIISLSGVLSLGPLAAARLGWAGLSAVPPRDYAMMLAAGTFNAGGFFALTRAMQFVPIAYINVVNSAQVAMAAAAGVILFHEPVTAWLAAGLVLSTMGIVLNRKTAR